MRISIASTLAALALAVSTSAHAGACFPGDSPFGDVPDNSLFCTEAMDLLRVGFFAAHDAGGQPHQL